MDKKTILVWPGGTEIGAEVARALHGHREFKVIGGGSDGIGAGMHHFKNAVVLPDIRDARWLGQLEESARNLGVDIIYPAHDNVSFMLAEAAMSGGIDPDLYRKVVTVGATPTILCRSKLRTYQALYGEVPVPKVFRRPASLPLFVKPDAGNGSRGCALVGKIEKLEDALCGARDNSLNGEALMLEYLPGEEYTVDCFSDAKGNLLWSQKRKRVETRSGISVLTRVVFNDTVTSNMAHRISQHLHLSGAWFYQVKERLPSHELVLMEVGTRIPGGAALARARGVNLPLLAVHQHLGRPVQILCNDWPRTLIRPLDNRYEDAPPYDVMYVDMDDTLVLDGKLNPSVVALMAQAQGNNVEVVIVTRRDYYQACDILHDLGLYELCTRVVYSGGSKSFHMDARPGVFIDDSFNERQSVKKDRPHVTTFDVPTAVEVLLDRRS